MKSFYVVVLILGSICLASAASSQRWYSADQLKQGEMVFKLNCASCHGQNAEGTANWKQTDANGKYPPPPLNGSAHAWHHDIDVLRRQIREGGLKLGGVMPAFHEKLSSAQIDQAIAYFQSRWPEDTYQKWSERFEIDPLPSLSENQKTDNNSVTQLLQKMLGNIELDAPQKTAIDDVWQVRLRNRFVYLVDDGQYALIGDLIDLQSGQNLTEKERRNMAQEAIAAYTDDDLAVFTPQAEVKATLNVFTDTSCPYCQKLHSELSELLKAGIRVRYLPFARGGKTGPGYQTMKSVWCATDRQQALTDAKNHKMDSLPAGDCPEASIVDRGYVTGNLVGVTGTPSLFKENGEKIEGYVPYQQLIPMLVK
jgi:thiol:disulfide interchange protein DsbC